MTTMGLLAEQRTSESLVAAARATVGLHRRPPTIVMESGSGAYLFDRAGNRYLDFFAGASVSSLGHGHSSLRAALHDQLDRLVHVGPIFTSGPEVLLLERLVSLSFADRVTFANSGSEANEAAIKLARRYQSRVRRESRRDTIVALGGSFHGRSLATLAASGRPAHCDGFEPLPAGFTQVPRDDLNALAETVDDRSCAVMIEPIQGESGVHPIMPELLAEARRLCDEHGIALIFDEVQCGVGRLGTLWAYESVGVVPDIATWSKGIGGGLVLGVMAASERFAQGFAPGSHGSTFAGNPLSCRAGLVVLDVLTTPGFLEQVRQSGERLRAGLDRLAERHPLIGPARGRGLMLGVPVVGRQAGRVVEAARQRGLLINSAGAETLRLLPPLIIGETEIDEALDRLNAAIESVE